jgi:two-component system chemotaxis response regulator CheY
MRKRNVTIRNNEKMNSYRKITLGEDLVKILIAEDDFASRKFMMRFLSKYGEVDVTVDGMEAIDAYTMALDANEPYELVCLDIMMPTLDGYQALKAIRDLEKERNLPEEKRAKVIMTTALSEGRNVTKAFELGCVAYAGKPIDQQKFDNVLKKLELIP